MRGLRNKYIINVVQKVLAFAYSINLLVTDPLYLVCMAKISILKIEGIIEKISYDRRAYESVDEGYIF